MIADEAPRMVLALCCEIRSATSMRGVCNLDPNRQAIAEFDAADIDRQHEWQDDSKLDGCHAAMIAAQIALSETG
jgi:hypothetical protein